VAVASPVDVEIPAEEMDAYAPPGPPGERGGDGCRAPVPHAAVSPEPRPQTRTFTSLGDKT
jgi:hypothetical protein